jgi:predicted glycosyltransferase involved in capsule biosynthesis
MKSTWVYTQIKDFFLMRIAPLLIPRSDEPLPEEIFSKDLPHLKISFCTTCMGRLSHLQKTYLENILNNIDYDNIEFVLVNYNSNDGLDEWAKNNLSQFIENETVNYFFTRDPAHFHMAKAKNLAHRLATGQILVNLDADNYLGKHNAFYINYLYNKKSNSEKAYCFSKPDFRYYDTTGRIAVKADSFMEIGGYREDLSAYGDEDLDLLRRLKINGIISERIKITNFLKTVKHSTYIRQKNLGNSGTIKSLREKNHSILQNTLSNSVVANIGGFQQFVVYKNFNKTPMTV